MIYFKWFLLSLFNLIFKYLIAWPLTPIVVLFTNRNGWLPSWLFWFQTPDNSLDGDSGWKNESRPYLIENNSYQRYINRCYWLWRNSLYGFNESVLAIDASYKKIKYSVIGDESVSNIPGKSGLVKRYLHLDGKLIAFHWYYVQQLKHWPKKCLRISLGWKLFGYKNSRANKIHMALSIGINKYA